MPNIIDISYFQKANELNIPLSIEVLTANPALVTPNSVEFLTLLCEKVEKSILLNALGLQVYNTLQLAIEDEFASPQYASYEKLVKGEKYNDKVWNGLDYDYSLIAYRILETFLTETNKRLSGVGQVQDIPEASNLLAPNYEIANANQKFLEQYQGGYSIFPTIYNDGEFIDWFGNQEGVEVSLYQYLVDKKDDFEGLDLNNFRTYEIQNSFGI